MATQYEQQPWNPEDVPEGFRIRQSGINDMLMCAHHWRMFNNEGYDRLPYIEAQPHKFGAMVRGSVVHAVSAHCRGNGGKYSDADVRDLMKERWELDDEAQRLTEDEAPNWRSASMWVMQHLQAHAYEKVLGVHVPLSDEECWLEYKGVPVAGEMDELVHPAGEDEYRIRDLKTGKNKPSATNLRSDPQVLLYTWGAYQRLGRLLPFEVWHMPSGTAIVPQDKAGKLRPITVDDLTRFEKTLDDYVLQALNGPWPKNSQRQYGGCSYCELYSECWG